MFGTGYRLLGSLGASRRMASDGSRGGLPPIPIVDDARKMMVALESARSGVIGEEAGSCIMMARPDGLDGSDGGPSMVAAVGKLFSYGLRPYDALYRFGDEMFLIVISHIKPEDVPVVMSRLRAVVSDAQLSLKGGGRVTVSLGGAMLDSGQTVEENLERVGVALQAAIRKGGDAVRMWSADLAGS